MVYLLHVVAAVLIVTALVIRWIERDALWAVLLSEVLGLLGLVWFVAPLLQRLDRFVKHGRE